MLGRFSYICVSNASAKCEYLAKMHMNAPLFPVNAIHRYCDILHCQFVKVTLQSS